MKKVLVILGPTATGKTDIGLELAKKLNGELVSCDSRQVYIGLDIGTGKMPSSSHPELVSGSSSEMPKRIRHDINKENGFWEINGIKIWMYDVCNPKDQFTVKDYVEKAEKIIADIHRRNKLPIIVGGTGFYLKALLEGLPNLAIPVDKKLRGELQRLSLLELQEKLKTLSPVKWKLLNESDRKNTRRLTRSIELVSMYGYTNNSDKRKVISKKYDVLKIGLTAPRENLNKKINLRVFKWIDDGIIDEVNNLLNQGINKKRFKDLGLNYAVIPDFLDRKISHKKLIERMQQIVRQYAKRQMTWFKNPSTGSGCINWFDITEDEWPQKLDKMILKWYD